MLPPARTTPGKSQSLASSQAPAPPGDVNTGAMHVQVLHETIDPVTGKKRFSASLSNATIPVLGEETLKRSLEDSSLNTVSSATDEPQPKKRRIAPTPIDPSPSQTMSD